MCIELLPVTVSLLSALICIVRLLYNDSSVVPVTTNILFVLIVSVCSPLMCIELLPVTVSLLCALIYIVRSLYNDSFVSPLTIRLCSFLICDILLVKMVSFKSPSI